MIKIDENELLIKGNTPSLMADLTVIIKEMSEKLDLDKADILNIVDTAFMSEEELDAEIEKRIDERSILVKILEKAAREAFKEVKDNGK